MANNCYFEMKARGENVKRLYDVLNYKDEEYVLGRVFSVDIVDETENTVFLCGDCAWSVYSAMLSYEQGKIKDKMLVTLYKLSEILNLDIEVISDEPGYAFGEHYYFEKGITKIEDCIDYLSMSEQYPGIEDVDKYLEESGEWYSAIGTLVNFEYL